MPDRTHAAVELDGTTLRFAEVHPERRTLLRLGRVVLDFDVRTALSHPGDERDALEGALADAFAGATPAQLTVALHPAGLTVWSAPLDPQVGPDARRDRLRREATLLTGLEADELALHVTPLYGDAEAEWCLVMALPVAWAEAIRGFDRSVSAAEVRVVPAAKGAVQALAVDGGRALTVGLYAHTAEVALVDDGAVKLIGHASTGDPADAAFTTLSLLTRSGLHGGPEGGVGTLALYGPGATPDAAAAFEGALGLPVGALDPFARLHVDAAPPPGIDLFAPVIGATFG